MSQKSEKCKPSRSVNSERSRDWKAVRNESVPPGFRRIFKPAGFPNESGLPEDYPLLEIPVALLMKLGFAAWLCFLAGILGISGSLRWILASILIVLILRFVMKLEIQIWQNADDHFRQSKLSEKRIPGCD